MNFGIPENFELTDGERIRDKLFIDSVRENNVLPLVSEISTVINGYENMSVKERFLQLAILNEQESCLGGGLIVALDKQRNWFEAHAGKSLPVVALNLKHSNGNTYRLTRPMFINDMYGASDYETMHPPYLPYRGSVLLEDFINGDEYAKLPPAYKVALLAKYVNENVSTTIYHACRFVIGGGELEGMRLNARLIFNRDGKQNGYLFRIGDVSPSNKFWLSLAEYIRHYKDGIDKLDEPYIDKFGDDASRFEGKKPIKEMHPSTTLLLAFVEDYVPSIGYYIGRNVTGNKSLKHMSWIRAHSLYDELYRDSKYWVKYKDEKDMADRYQKAAKRRNAIEERWERR